MTLTAEAAIFKATGHAFADTALLQRALTHRSAGGAHYERLEFLGDALLNLAISEAICAAAPRADEGELSRWRAHLVCEDSLARIARNLHLGDYLHLGAGELKSGGWRRDSILADVLEALLGAIHLDGGFIAARNAVLKLFDGLLNEAPQADALKDSKTRLQEWLQAVPRPLPEYRLVSESGPAHRCIFVMACRLPDTGLETQAGGTSRKQAEQDAARLMIAKLKEAPHA